MSATILGERMTAEFSQVGRIAFDATSLGPVVTLTFRGSRAVVALQGAQLLSWVPAGHRDVIWLSSDTKPKPGKALRGGTPVCWPWFGSLPDAPQLPAHGFVRGAPWSVVAAAATDTATSVMLQADQPISCAGLNPPEAHLTLEVRLAEDLSLVLTTYNRSRGTLAITQALHTYFSVDDIAVVEIDGLDGCPYIDTVGGISRRVQHGPIRFAGETDRIYLDTSEAARTARISVIDPALGRRIDITSEGSASAVVWNPWIEKSTRLGDMGPEGYRRMVCVETANAADDAIAIMPDALHRLMATYRVGAI